MFFAHTFGNDFGNMINGILFIDCLPSRIQSLMDCPIVIRLRCI